jgi:hypothetical protein
MRPSDVLAYRRLLYDWTREQLRLADQHGIAADDLANEFLDTVRDCLAATSQGEAYFVSADMTAVAVAAAKTMPIQELRRDDLPSAAGFLLYDRPIGTWGGEVTSDREPEPVDGFAWVLEGPQPVWDYPSDLPDDRPPDREEEYVAVYPLGRNERMFPPMMPLTQLGTPMGWPIGDRPVNDFGDLGPVLLASWTLMQQTLTVSERTTADRAERRRCSRTGLASEVVTVRLRRKSLDEPRDDGEEGGVAWSHRWLVSGHWRNQWLPSRTCHRLQWIHGYVKGPAHKALVVKDRVTAWIR